MIDHQEREQRHFAGGCLGAIVLPIMIYHQIQLIVCAMIAQRYARDPVEPVKGDGGQ